MIRQTYKLYLESGPKKKKTKVHVLEVLGCIAKGKVLRRMLEHEWEHLVELSERLGNPL